MLFDPITICFPVETLVLDWQFSLDSKSKTPVLNSFDWFGLSLNISLTDSNCLKFSFFSVWISFSNAWFLCNFKNNIK